jgi:hypothetical protein
MPHIGKYFIFINWGIVPKIAAAAVVGVFTNNLRG